MKRIAGAVVAMALLGGACADAPSVGGEAPRLVALEGDLRILRGDDTVVVDEAVPLEEGDRIVAGEDARARVELDGEQTLELSPGSELSVDGGPVPRLERGSVLATAGVQGLMVPAGDDRIEGRDSVFRVDRGFSTTVAVYRGAATVLGPDVEISALRELTVVAAANVPLGAQPLAVRPNHPWDVRLLGSAIDVGLGLARLERGLRSQLPQRGAAANRAVLDVLSKEFRRSFLGKHLSEVAAAELVVAAQLARRASELSDTAATRALNQIVRLRGEGAQWIVVVAEWGLTQGPLLQSLGRLAGRIAEALTSAAGPSGPGTPGAAQGPGAAPGGDQTTPGAGPAGPGPAGPGPAGPAPGPGGGGSDPGPGGGGGGDDDPPPSCANTVECVVEDVLKGVNSKL